MTPESTFPVADTRPRYFIKQPTNVSPRIQRLRDYYFQGVRRCGRARIDWVYNSMPPNPGQVYPEIDLEAVRQF